MVVGFGECGIVEKLVGYDEWSENVVEVVCDVVGE